MDPMTKDKKQLPMTGPVAIFWFFVYVFIVLPVLLVALLPIALISIGTGKFLGLFNAKKIDKTPTSSSSYGSLSASDEIPPTARPYDIVLFGATGFTGRMAAIYIAKTYGTQFKWAIAGRRLKALEDIRRELTLIDSKLNDIPLLIADSSDVKSLIDLARSSRVVITTAGLV